MRPPDEVHAASGAVYGASTLGELEHKLDPSTLKPPISAIVCAGMRGAESAALMVADAARLKVGGWSHASCLTPPTGHKTTPANTWTQSVAHNVRDSDATMVFTFSPPNGPTRIALRRAEARGKPNLHVTLRPRGIVSSDAISRMRAWLVQHDINVLHVTGSRQEVDSGIEQAVVDVLVAILEAA